MQRLLTNDPLLPPIVFGSGTGNQSCSGVAALVDRTRSWGNLHDRASRDTLLTRIASLVGLPLATAVDACEAASGALLLVPGEAIDAATAADAGIVDRERILGGVVPAAFVGTKAITHGLVSEDAERPALWSTTMRRLMGDAALHGYTVFSHFDAELAGRLLLTGGPVRIKDVCAKAGLGQIVVRTVAELDAALAREDAAGLAEHGLVLEENLTDVVTYSIGTIELGGRRISYWGSQNLTTDHAGREVYGGSDLYAVRGGFDALGEQPLPAAIARAASCAATFDRAAHVAYPDVMLTRRNYDVIDGRDASGKRKIGVLEQSWRVGGASGAEIAAFEAFDADPTLGAVRCSTVEVYDIVTPPVGATIYFRGVDPVVGAMTKYAVRQA